ncbi:MAG: YbhB/YbcL family Raf kinase inhibitor-like protein [Rhodocyclaceae bacterium]|nr:MAG: YbhB/YbcL family Raf kinase inhibitor-like protein [Rhodocyclaceae bacterium]
MKSAILGIALAAVSFSGRADTFTLSSSDVGAHGKIAESHVFNSFGCTGGNVSPTLTWKNVPTGAKSLALTVYDPDAPTGSGWWHWIVYDISPNIRQLPASAGNTDAVKLPTGGLQGRTDFGKPGWGGPCPPKGDKPHRYFFTLYALKTAKLDVPVDASGALIGYMIHMNQIGKAEFMATYGR